jgi:hypothetical protein
MTESQKEIAITNACLTFSFFNVSLHVIEAAKAYIARLTAINKIEIFFLQFHFKTYIL